jgi:cell division protein FtsQ
MLKKILHISLWVLLIVALLTSVAFVEKKQPVVRCHNVYIDIDHNTELYFVQREDVIQLIKDKGDSLFNQPLNSIDVNQIEKTLNSHPSIANAEVYVDVNGDVSINITQRKPIARVINALGESYYIDDKGLLMPLSDNYTSRVVVVNGKLFESYAGHYLTNYSAINDSVLKTTWLDDVYAIAKYLDANEFWKSQIVQIYIDKEIELVPRVGNQRIIFGDASDLEDKFKKLFVLYTKGLSKTGWNAYSVINLKFKNQVVCTKAI